jgi:cytochrome P450
MGSLNPVSGTAIFPYQYFPFGGGNPRFIGMAFAQFELKLILVKVLSSGQMELADTKPVQPVRGGFLLRPSEGVKMAAKGMRYQNHGMFQTRFSSV